MTEQRRQREKQPAGCVRCGKVFWAGPYSWICPACRRKIHVEAGKKAAVRRRQNAVQRLALANDVRPERPLELERERAFREAARKAGDEDHPSQVFQCPFCKGRGRWWWKDVPNAEGVSVRTILCLDCGYSIMDKDEHERSAAAAKE